MRRLFTFLSLFVCLAAFAQEQGDTMYIYRNDGVVERVLVEQIDSVTFTRNVVTGENGSTMENGYEYVDLGLSVKWATHNVGATAPHEYGGYYAWGETEEKHDYSWVNYKWCNGSYETLTKYSSEGITLEPEDDVAHVKWGGKWRMPTVEEVEELVNKCDWTLTSVNGINGYKVTGYNGNSIFLPAAGHRDGVVYGVGEVGYYCSSTLYDTLRYQLYLLYCEDGYYTSFHFNRDDGYTVRPVCE